MKTNKIVIFGAGKIGRSFIGQLFNLSGYQVVFVDIDETLIKLINEKKCYQIVVKDGNKDETLLISNVSGICLNDEEEVVKEVKDAEIVSLSVGQSGLLKAIPVIVKSLIARRDSYGEIPIDIIIAENMRNADVFIRNQLKQYLPSSYPLSQLVGLIETSIGKMVPIMTQEDFENDPLQVFAEPYNSLIVAKNGFKNSIPDIADLAPKENIKAWVDRKLFIHNLGHATTAYLGFKIYPEAVYIYELFEDLKLLKTVQQTMLQSAEILMTLYPEEFTFLQLEKHIDDLLIRFKNKSLGDTLFRVGCDLYRKLGPEDRLVAPVQKAIIYKKSFDLILNAIKAGISFRAKDQNGNYLPSDKLFFEEAKKGHKYILKEVCKLPDELINT